MHKHATHKHTAAHSSTLRRSVVCLCRPAVVAQPKAPPFVILADRHLRTATDENVGVSSDVSRLCGANVTRGDPTRESFVLRAPFSLCTVPLRTPRVNMAGSQRHENRPARLACAPTQASALLARLIRQPHMQTQPTQTHIATQHSTTCPESRSIWICRFGLSWDFEFEKDNGSLAVLARSHTGRLKAR